MAEVLFILEKPTPQRTPTLDAIFERGLDLTAFYHTVEDSERGWGPIAPRHPWQAVPAGRTGSIAFLARQVVQRDVRVVCCFGYTRPANIVSVLLARLRGIPVVVRSDSNWAREQQRPRYRRLLKRTALRLLYGRRTRVWTVGSNNERYWSEMGLPNRHLIPYGAPRPPVGSRDDGEAFRLKHGLGTGMVILFVGRLVSEKGIDLLVGAFQSLPDPGARLVIVGQGVLGALVEAAAHTDSRIVACGTLSQAELGPAFAAADLVALPARYEAWGLVVNEALSNGVRVLASDAVGSAADCLDAGNGCVVKAGDAAQLAAALKELAGDYARGWPRLPAVAPYDAADDMIDDLVRLGARPRPLSGQAEGFAASIRSGPAHPGPR